MRKIKVSGVEALVDQTDYEQISKWKWYLSRKGKYAVTNIKRKGRRTTVGMHRMIMGLPTSKHIDHINGDSLDNRRANLRICTPAQNAWNANRVVRNKHGLKGITWLKGRNKWKATLKVNMRTVFLGYFANKKLAANAYVEGVKKYHGEFARGHNAIPLSARGG